MGEAGPRIAFYVQHLLGVGHLARAFRIADALVADGWQVRVIVGGELPPIFQQCRAQIVPLPPVRAAAGGLSQLTHPDGRPFDRADEADRRAMLLAEVQAFDPDLLLIEAYPFGRRQMRFELLPLLETMKNRARPPLVAASIRDILQENRRADRVEEALQLVERYFDCVLVHGDPALVPLDASFPAAARIAGKLVYTGLVTPPFVQPAAASSYDIVVSVGGGAVGESLLRSAVEARPLSCGAGLRWLMLTGPNLPPDVARSLEPLGRGNVTVLPFIADLSATLARARLSVSQAGYNTVADILRARCRAVLVPYAQSGETEQSVRATRLAERSRAVVVSEHELDPTTLAAAIDSALGGPAPSNHFDLSGAANTARMLRQALAGR